MNLPCQVQKRRYLHQQFDPVETGSSSREASESEPPKVHHTASADKVSSLPTNASQSKPKPPNLPRHSSVETWSSFSSPLPNSSTPKTSPSHAAETSSARNHVVATNAASHAPKSKGKATPILEGPLHDKAFITREHKSNLPIKPQYEYAPKSFLGNFAVSVSKELPRYKFTAGTIMHSAEGSGNASTVHRCTVSFDLDRSIIGIGDHSAKKQAEKLAALSVIYQLHSLGKLDQPKSEPKEIKLADGSNVDYERACKFMDYYCRRYDLGKPDITFQEASRSGWDAVMVVGGRRVGFGYANTKKGAQLACYLDVTRYLEGCDPELWKDFVEASKSGADLGLAPRVFFQMSDRLDDEIKDLCDEVKASKLYRNRPAVGSAPSNTDTNAAPTARTSRWRMSPGFFAEKSKLLLRRHQDHLVNPATEAVRKTRAQLPVYTRADELISHFNNNDVTICMAATGSGKTTQVPQLILDAFIARGQGARCNIICTQPRRLAAISVAHRVAKERDETVGRSVGYQVRFEAKLPEEHGSITFCTTGVFLKRLQSALSESPLPSMHPLDNVTHIIVDEVHERDIDTDLLLVVLKRLLADRKAKKKPLKVILMSATIDPALFQKYFPDDAGRPAKVIDVPGRSFPVTQHFLEDFVPHIAKTPSRWVLGDESVARYLTKELGLAATTALGIQNQNSQPDSERRDDDLEIPHSLIAATICHIINTSHDGHVLVFLPGWDEIVAAQRALQTPREPLDVDFNDSSKFSIHLLHSSIPLAEQQAVFDPPSPGIRRIIFATNIAETSVTIPDVVYVVDTAKVKEQRYDSERRMSSLISTWIGSSNLKQRAGRAGRHRSGEYFGVLGREHAEALHPYQTVEMKRSNLSNVVMHIKALNFPGMTVEEVLAATIEPPASGQVAAAMKDLQMVGALDADKNLTSLGRVLLQIPVDVQVGRMVLYGSFFRCLDDALTLAAILTNRDPFMSPKHLKAESAATKNSWSPKMFRSDALATLQAFKAWWAMQSRGEYVSANRFCVENFLAKPTLVTIQKIKVQLLQSLYHAGVIDVSAGGRVTSADYDTRYTVPPALNINGGSLPVLAALICIASQPNFAIRIAKRTHRTSQDKITFIHPSSVNTPKTDPALPGPAAAGEKQLFAFAEKRRNVSTGADNPQTFLVTTTRLDPMTYMLFGAYKLQVVGNGLECDNWLPVVGNLDALNDVHRLKTLMEGCMLRVFEGITMGKRNRRQSLPVLRREEGESESGDEDDVRDLSLAQDEVLELDMMTRGVVQILKRYSAEDSGLFSQPAPPMGSPTVVPTRTNTPLSGHSTPTNRPSTPSKKFWTTTISNHLQ